MTNVSTPVKKKLRVALKQAALDALASQGWKVEKPKGYGSSVRLLRRGAEQRLVSIRTSQGTQIAFPRDADGKWVSLNGVDVVIAASVDNYVNPTAINVHWMDAKVVKDSFDRTFAARMSQNHTIPVGRGVWLPLYEAESNDTPRLVGSGLGLKFPPIYTIPLNEAVAKAEDANDDEESDEVAEDDAPDAAQHAPQHTDEVPMTIAEAKRRLAVSLGVDPSNIKITIEG
jgi:hypothetical protein